MTKYCLYNIYLYIVENFDPISMIPYLSLVKFTPRNTSLIN